MTYKAGLLVFIYRDGSDCTNGGVTSDHDRAILAWGKGPEIFTPSDTAPLLELQERYGRLIAVPVNDPRLTDGKHSGPMFGGNFVYTSDSRFPNEYPIPVHDRFET